MSVVFVGHNDSNISKYFTKKQLEQLKKNQPKSQQINETSGQEDESDNNEMEYFTE